MFLGYYSLALWERGGVRAAFARHANAANSQAFTLTPTLSPGERG